MKEAPPSNKTPESGSERRPPEFLIKLFRGYIVIAIMVGLSLLKGDTKEDKDLVDGIEFYSKANELKPVVQYFEFHKDSLKSIGARELINEPESVISRLNEASRQLKNGAKILKELQGTNVRFHPRLVNKFLEPANEVLKKNSYLTSGKLESLIKYSNKGLRWVPKKLLSDDEARVAEFGQNLIDEAAAVQNFLVQLQSFRSEAIKLQDEKLTAISNNMYFDTIFIDMYPSIANLIKFNPEFLAKEFIVKHCDNYENSIVIQKMLRDENLYHGKIDGDCADGTRNALIRYFELGIEDGKFDDVFIEGQRE